MDETDYLLGSSQCKRSNKTRQRCWISGVLRLAVLLIAASGAVLLALRFANPWHPRSVDSLQERSASTLSTKNDKVLVELFVMSRCPDAVKVEDVFSSVVPAVHSIMDIQLSFIATLQPNATFGAVCKHGDEECRGNVDELCALKHRPSLPAFWRFLTCLNSRLPDIGRDPDLSLKCASSAGLDTAAFLTCSTEGEGLALFKQSAENALFAGVKTSATVFIDGKPRCVEDGGWRDCPGGHQPADFIRDICAAYQGSAPKPSICGQYRPSALLDASR
ncbi:hypothetical protein GGI12_003000 [Dipsacomyces acuminosporus]|nr:hypothetical protein GGI12_003000 [Dipsacomyces acuminosporus]